MTKHLAAQVRLDEVGPSTTKFQRLMAALASGSLLLCNGPALANTAQTVPIAPPAPIHSAGQISNNPVTHVTHHANSSANQGTNSGTSSHAAIVNTQKNVVDPISGQVNGLSATVHTEAVQSQTLQMSASGKAVPLSHGVSLDLSSNAKTIQVGSDALGGQSSVSITVGGKSLTVQAGSMVTAAEFVALQQQLPGGGTFQISLSSVGTAAGGTLSINGLPSTDPVASLVIPKGVTALDNLGAGALKLSGNLVDDGSLYTYSNNNAITVGAVQALNINVGSGGSLSSNLPSSVVAEVGKTVTGFGLNLTATDTIQNAGSITSSGSLSLATSNLQNTGTVQSLHGDINVSAPAGAPLNINGGGGKMLAQAGNINLSSGGNLNVSGGDYVSNQFNLNAPGGTANVTVGQLSGQVNVNAQNAHIIASTENLDFGTMNVQGDPTYGNLIGAFSSTGISASNGQSITIAAAGDVDITGGALNTSSATGGGELNIIAGANLTGGPINTNPITVNGASATGGIINLTGVTGITTATTGTGNGGNVTMIANAGTEIGSGTITIPATTTITTTGGGGTSGNVLLIAGATGGNGISTGAITTTGGAAGTGSVTLRTSAPNVSTGGVAIDAGGTITSGSFGAGGTTQSSIQSGAISTNGGGVAVAAGSNVTLNGNVSSNGGDVAILAGGNVASGNSLSLSTAAGGTTNSGNLTVIAGATLLPDPVSSNATEVNVVGRSASGGSIDFNTNAITTLTTGNTGTGSNGNMTIAAFDGAQAGSGTVTLPAALTVTTGGNVNTGGTLTVIGGATAGTAVKIGNIDTSGPGPSTGGNVTLAAAAPEVGSYGASFPWLVTNSGTILAGDIVAGDVRASALQTGTITVNSANVSVQAGGNVSVGNVSAPSTTSSSSINITSGGTLTSGATISAASTATGITGGFIQLTAQSLPGVTTVSADGATGGGSASGGQINITQTGTNTLTIGAAGLTLSAKGGSTGGNAGIVEVITGGNLTVAAASITIGPAAGATSAGGGILTLTAGTAGPGNLAITGNLIENGASTTGNAGAGGVITLTSNSATAFSLNTASPVNGTTGSISATPGGGGGSGGVIEINNNGTGGIAVGAPGNLTVDTVNPTGVAQVGGVITINAPGGPVTFTNPSAVGGGALSVSASGSGGTEFTQAGGIISITGGSIAVTGNTNAPTLALSANGAGPGDGGIVTIKSLNYANVAADNITIGSATNNISITATGGTGGGTPSATGNGGIVTVNSGNNLTVDAGAISINPLGTNGNGGQLNLAVLSQGNGALALTGLNPLVLNGAGTGTGGQVGISATTTAPVTINGTVTLNGGTGVSSSGGALTITNGSTGGVSFGPNGANALSISATGTLVGNTGSISVTSELGPISVASGKTAANMTAGGITLNSFSMSITGGVLALNSDAQGTTAGRGSIDVVVSGSASDLTVGSTAGDITISEKGGSVSGGGGSITLSAGRNLTVDPTAITTTAVSGSGVGYNLSAGTTGPASLQIVGNVLTDNGVGSGQGGGITITAPSLNIGNTSPLQLNANGGATGAGGVIDLSVTSALNTVTVGTANGDIKLSAAGGSTSGGGGSVIVNAGGSLVVDPAAMSVNPTSGSGGNVTLNAAQTNNGNLSIINNALSVDGTAGNIGGSVNITLAGSGQNTLTISENITARGTGALTIGQSAINITNNSAGPTLINGNLIVDQSNGEGGAISVTTSGTLSIGATSFSANANLISGASAQYDAGNITINAPTIALTGGSPVALTANAGTTSGGTANVGAGGTISVTSNNGAITVGNAAGAFTLSAVGGSTFSISNGSVTLSAGTTIVVDAQFLTVGPNTAVGSGVTNAQGGAISLTANGGNISVSSSGSHVLSAAGLGFGSGNNITIEEPYPDNTINITTNLVADGGTTGGNGGEISVSGTNNTTINLPSLVSSNAAQGVGGDIFILASDRASVINIPNGGVISATNGPGSNANEIEVEGGSIVIPSGGAAATITTENTGTTGINNTAGAVYVSTSSPTSDLHIGTGNGALTINTQAGYAGDTSAESPGNISVTAGRNLTVDPAGLQLTGLGANYNTIYLSLQAGAGAGNQGNLLVTNSVIDTAQGSGSVNGGVTLTSSSFNPFVLGGGVGTLNGVQGSVQNFLSNNNATFANISINNNGTGGITLTNPQSNIQVFNGTTGEGNIRINAGNGPVNIITSTASTLASSINASQGGSINIMGATINVLNAAQTAPGPALTLDANSPFTGSSAGSITVTTTGSTGSLRIGNAAGNLILTATAGFVTDTNAFNNGGFITVTAGNDLFVNPTFLTAQPLGTAANNVVGAGAHYTLTAGGSVGNDLVGLEGKLVIQGGLDASGVGAGSAGSISLASNNSASFTINDGPTVNGINGQLTANAGSSSSGGGTITVINYGSGGITLPNPADVQVANTANSFGQITLNAGNGTLFIGGSNPLSVSNGAAPTSAFSRPSITIEASTLILTSGSLTINAGSTASGAAAGDVTVTTFGHGAQYSVASSGGLVINAQAGFAGDTAEETGATITLSAGGTLFVNTNGLNTQILGSLGAGANLTFTAGTAGSGNIDFIQAFSADAVGSSTAGSIFATAANGSITVGGASGVLSANGFSGGTVNLTASQGITFLNPPATISANGTGSTGGSVTLAAGAGAIDFGSMSANPGTINVAATGSGSFNGGSVTISGNGILLNAARNNLVVSADGVGAFAGTISLTNTAPDTALSPTAGDLTVGSNNGQIGFSVQGNGTGSNQTNLLVSTGGNLTVNPGGLTLGTTTGATIGSSLTFIAGTGGSGGLTLTNSLDVSGAGNGNGGQIVLQSFGNQAVTINGNVSANGGVGGQFASASLAAGAIDIENFGSGGITFASGTSVSANSFLSTGGTITINAHSGVLTFAGNNSVTASAYGTIGSFNFGAFNPSGGGTIKMVGSSIVNSGAAALPVQANGVSSFDGGSIHIETIAANASLTIGNAAGDFTVSATGSGSDVNGSITLWAGKDLTVDPSVLAAGFVGNIAGSGAAPTFDFEAGGNGSHQGNLTILGSLIADNTAPSGNDTSGQITLVMNSTLPFVIGGTGTNSLNGVLSAQNSNQTNIAPSSSITVINNGPGGITVNNPASINLTSAFNGGTLTLHTGGALTIAAGTLSAADPVVIGGATGGTINLTGSTITVTGGGVLNLNVDGSGNGGQINILSSSAAGTLNIGNVAGSIAISATSGTIGTSAAINQSGFVSIQSNGVLNVNSAAINETVLGLDQPGAGIVLIGGSNGSGNLTVTGPIAVNGVGAGSGGGILLIDISNTALALNSNLSANSGMSFNSTPQTGGTITVEILGTGGVTSATAVNIAANGVAGGNVQFNQINDSPTSIQASPLNLLAGSTISASALAGDNTGGSINVFVSNLNPGGSGTLNFKANASGGGNGGLIDLTQNAGNFNFGTGGNLTAQATGGASGTTTGDGGTLDLNTIIGNTTINPANVTLGPLGQNGAGATFNLQTGNSSSLLITGTFSVNGVGIGNGGSFTAAIATSNSAPFTIGSLSAIAGVQGNLTANAGNTSGTGGTINISNSGLGGIVIASGANISASAAAGNAGNITLNADAGGQGALTFSAGATGLTLNGSGTFTGGTLTIDAVTINTPSGGYSISANGGGNGGIINITTSGSPVTGGALALSANSATGTGGEITVKSLGNSPISIANAAAGIGLSATGVNGGSVSVSSGSSLTVTATQINVAPTGANGNGGTIELSSGSAVPAALSITGALHADGVGTGNGGTIDLTSLSTTVFTVGAASANGISGAVTANAGSTGNGGSIQIIGQAGLSVTLGTALLTASSVNGNGGSLALSTSGTLTFNDATPSLSMNGGTGNFAGGSISLTGNLITTPNATSAFTVSANGSGTGSGGIISINSSSLTSGTLTAGTAAGNFTLSANAGAFGGNGGSVTLQAMNVVVNTGGISVATGSGNGNGGSITITGGKDIGSVIVNAPLAANGSGTGAGGNVTIEDDGANQVQINGNISANAGSLGSFGGTIQISNGSFAGFGSAGGILIKATSITANAAAGGGGVIQILADTRAGNAPLSIGVSGSATTISANGGDGGSGGTVSLTGGTLSLTSGLDGGLVLQANGDATAGGNGGTVHIQISNNGSQAVIVDGTNLNGLTISVAGSSPTQGAYVGIFAGGNLIINPASITLSTVGAGASLDLEAGRSMLGQFPGQYHTGGTLVVNGNLSVNGDAVTNSGTNNYANALGGSITLVSDSANPFQIGAGAPNGINGSLTAVGSNGGTIDVLSFGAGGINVLSTATIAANGLAGSGGSLTLDAAPGAGQTGSVLLGQGPLVIGASALTVSGVGPGPIFSNQNGGTIILRGLNITNTSGLPLMLNAMGGTNQNGGFISVTTTSSAADLLVGNSGGQEIEVAAGAGAAMGNFGVSTNGGTVNFSAGGNLTVITQFFSAAPQFFAGSSEFNNSSGANITLIAGTAGPGNLGINGSLNVDSFATPFSNSSPGSLTLSSNSSLPFTVDSVGSTNGIGLSSVLSASGIATGNALAAPAGNISIANIGSGGVTINVPQDIQIAGGSEGSGQGQLSLIAGTQNIVSGQLVYTPTGPLTINSTGGASLAVNGGTQFGNGGTLTFVGTTIASAGGVLTLSANAGGQSSGVGGTIYLQSNSNLTVGSVTGGIVISAQGGSSGLPTGGTVTLRTQGSITVDGNYISVGTVGTSGTAGTINLNAGTAGSTGDILITNNLSANGVGAGSGGFLNLSWFDGTNPFVVGSGATVNGINGSLTANSGLAGSVQTGLETTNAGQITLLNNATTGTAGLTINPANISLVASGGDGGVLTIGSTNGGTVTISSGTLSVDGFAGYSSNFNGETPLGAGGIVIIGTPFQPQANVNLVISGNLNISANSYGGGTGFNNTLLTPAGTIDIFAGQTTITGGLLNLTANGSANVAGAAAPGGTVIVQGTAVGNNLTIGSANGDINISAAGGDQGAIEGGAGGVVSVAAGGNLTVNPANIVLSPRGYNGNGAYLGLFAGASGTGNLSISGSLSVNGAGLDSGGTLVLDSNSPTPFDLGAGIQNPTNGIFGSLSATSGTQVGYAGSFGQRGGQIQVFNAGTGGVNVISTALAALNVSGGNSGGSVFFAPLQQNQIVDPNGTNLSVFQGSVRGPVLLPGGTINVAGNANSLLGAAGGTFEADGTVVNVVFGGTLNVNVGAGPLGAAGTVNIDALGQGAITFGTAAGNINIISNVSDPGNQRLSLTSQRVSQFNLNVTAPEATVVLNSFNATTTGNADGMSLDIQGQTVSSNVVGGLNANGVGFGSGGEVFITSTSSTALTVNSAGNVTNGILGPVTANSGAVVLPSAGLGTHGGTVEFDNIGGNVSASTSQISASSVQGNGGFVGFYAGYLTEEGTFAITPGTITLTTGTNLASSTINVNGGSSGTSSGGGIQIIGSNIVVSSPSAQPLTLSADGSFGGDSGKISVISSATTSNLTVGGGAGGITVIDTGGFSSNGSQASGYAEIVAGGNLTVNPVTVVVGAPAGAVTAQGGNLTLRAGYSGTGNLQISGNITANGAGTGNGGTVVLLSDSATAFTIGGSTANSINGNISANSGNFGGAGGTIMVTNLGSGGVTLNNVSNLAFTGAGGQAGTLILNDSNSHSPVSIPGLTGDIAVHTGLGPLSLPAATLAANGGAAFPMPSAVNAAGLIDLGGSTINLPSFSIMTLQANASSSAPGSAGSVIITSDVINVAPAAFSGGSFHIQLEGSFTNSSSAPNLEITATYFINLEGGLILGSSGFSSNGPNITLNAGTAPVNPSSLTIVGNLSANGVGTGNGGNISLSYNAAPGNNFTIGSQTGNNYVSGNLTADAANGQPGNITITNTNLLATSGTNVVVAAGATLSALGPVNTLDGTTYTGGVITIGGGQSYQSASLTVPGTGTVNGIINATGSTVTITSASTANPVIALGKLQAEAGNIVVTNNGTNGSNSGIVVVPFGNLSAQNNTNLAGTGSITLQTNDQTTGFIQVLGNSILQAEGVAAAPGTVTLTVGTAAQNAGATPADTFVTAAGGSSVFFGTDGITTLPTANTITTTAANANVTFSQATSSTPISLLGGVTIITGASALSPTVALQSLDLSNSTVFNQLSSLQTAGLLAGNLSGSKTLTLDEQGNGGVLAVGLGSGGGNNSSSSGGLTAMNIPTGFNVTLDNYQGDFAVNVALTYNSTTLNVPINGTLNFNSSPGASTLNIVSNNLPQLSPGLSIGASGIVNATNGLIINTGSATSQSSSQNPGMVPVSNAGTISVSSGNLSINAQGTITNTGTMTVANGGLSLVAVENSNGSIVMNGNLNANGANGFITVHADDSGTLTYAPTTLVTPVLNLQTENTDMGTAVAPIVLPSTVPMVTATTNGNTFITAANTFTFGPSLVASELSTWTTVGNLQTSGDVAATTTVLQTFDTTSGHGNIIINGDLGSDAATSTLIVRSSNATITDTASTGTDAIHGFPVALEIVNGTASAGVGTTTTPLRIQAAAFFAQAGTGLINVFDANTTGVTIYGNNTGANSYTFTSIQGITVTANTLTTPSQITLATQNNGSLVFGGALGLVGGVQNQIGNANAVVNLSAGGTGLIQQLNGNGYVVQANSLTMSGAGGGMFVGFDANTVTTTGSGIVSLGNFSFNPSTINASSAATNFSYGGNGSLSLNNVTANNGFVNILSDGATLQVNSGANVLATNGFILFRQANTATGDIVISGGATKLNTAGTGGPVDIIIGVSVPTPVVGTKPGNVVINNSGGTAYFGTNSISVPAPTATLNLQGSNIQFSTGTRPASAITLGSGVTITADPVGPGFGSVPQNTTLLNASALANVSSSVSLPVLSPSALIAPVVTSSLASSVLSASTGPGLVSVIRQDSLIESPQAQARDAASTSALYQLPLSGSTVPSATATNGAVPGAQTNNTISPPPMPGTTVNPVSDEAGVQSINNSPTTSSDWSAFNSQARSGCTMVDIQPRPDGCGESFQVDIAEPAKFGISQNRPVSDLSYADADEPTATSTQVDKTTGHVTLVTGVKETKRPQRKASLRKGNVLLAPFIDTVIDTPAGSIHLAANSVALIAVNGSQLSVYDLDDRHNHSIEVVSGQDHISLAPGQHVTLTSENISDFENANLIEFIGYRGIRAKTLGNGIKAFTSEFAIMSVVNNIKSVKGLANSQHPVAKRLSQHILKTNAILLTTQRSGEPYQLVLRPRVTAMR